MDAVLGTFTKSRSLRFSSRPLGDFEENSDDVDYVNFDPPLKAVIDLLTDVVELNNKRFEYLRERLHSFAQKNQSDLDPANKLTIRLFNNLNIASAMPTVGSENAITSVRTDYIGLDVDRFFRIAKFCRPSLLTVGDALMDCLGCECADIPSFEHLAIKTLHQPVPAGAGVQISRRNVVIETLRQDQLKGVGQDYQIYHMFALASLHSDAFYPMPNRRDLMKPTRAFLAEHGFYAISRNALQA